MKSSSSEPGPRQNVQKMFRHVLPHYGSTVVTASKTVTDHFYPQFALILLKIKSSPFPVVQDKQMFWLFLSVVCPLNMTI